MLSSRVVSGAANAVRGTRDALLAPPRWWRELLIIVVIFGVYRWVQTIVRIDPGPAYARGRTLLHVEAYLHIDVERSLNHMMLGHPLLAYAANYYYVTLHGAVTCIVIIWLFWAHPRVYPAARLSLAGSTIISFIVFAVVPTAPPRLLSNAHFVDTLAHWHTLFSYDSELVASTADEFAAMPSLHVAWALWAGLYTARVTSRWWLRGTALAYPALTSLVVVVTANHYVLDIVGGAAIVGIGELARTAVIRLPGRRRVGATPRQADEGGSPHQAA